jgi:hypothetical protein
MQGSLEDPPIVVRGSRRIHALYLLVALVFVATGAWQVGTETPQMWAWLCIVFFGLGSLVFIAQLIRPGLLAIAPDGVTMTVLWRTHRYGWAQIASFRTQRVGLMSRHVWFDLQKTPDGDIRMGSFGTGWETRAQALCDLLNAARGRWGGAG